MQYQADGYGQKIIKVNQWFYPVTFAQDKTMKDDKKLLKTEKMDSSKWMIEYITE